MFSALKIIILCSLFINYVEFTEAASDLRRAKYIFAFNVFFDYDTDGNIDKSEVDLLITYLAEIRGWEPTEFKYIELQKIWHKWWNIMLKGIDTDKNNLISAKEWIKGWDEFTENEEMAIKRSNYYEEAVFYYIDDNKDKVIIGTEFIPVYSFFGIETYEVAAAFLIASRGNATITREEYHQLWTEFFSSDDSHVPGNYIVGSMSF